MPSNELKRQFTLGKMEKDKDDRLVEPGAYRDANNVDVARSEGDDSGALQVVRGNRLVADQERDWSIPDTDPAYDAELVKPFGETIGVYSYPQEEKVYFFNTGRPVDPNNPDVEQPLQNAIYEYDQVNDVVSPILIETDQGDYEAGGNATQEFIGELFDTQVWSKVTYQDATDVGDNAFQYTESVSLDQDDFSIIQLTCSSNNVIERDDEDNPVCRVNGECDGELCDCGTEGCDEVLLFFEASDGELVCRINGDPNMDTCDCGDVGPNSDCDYVELACGEGGGLTRTEEDCQSAPGAISPDVDFEFKDRLILEYNASEWPTTNWEISPDPNQDIQLQTITQSDLDNSTCVDRPGEDVIGQVRYTLNGNGATRQPEQFCDPRCNLVYDPTCTPTEANNNCYVDYCRQTPLLDGLFNTQLTEEAVEDNALRTVTMTNVPGVTDGEVITATLKRLRDDANILTATYDGEKYNFDAIDADDVKIAENAVILRGLDALDFQQLDQIFGRVGLASRPVGYTYRVARNGNLSWVPNTDDVFQAIPDPNTDTQAVLSNIDPNDAAIPPAGEVGQALEFDVEVDRQQTFDVNLTDISDDIHDPDDPQYIDDNTRQ